MVKEKAVEESPFKVVQVATQTESVIVNEAEETRSIPELLAEIANDVKTLKKHLVG